MAGMTLAQAEQHLNEWLSADSAVAKGQAYSLGGRTSADLDTLRAEPRLARGGRRVGDKQRR